jgi:hypothetical protein
MPQLFLPTFAIKTLTSNQKEKTRRAKKEFLQHESFSTGM